jgi:hypothetical protein
VDIRSVKAGRNDKHKRLKQRPPSDHQDGGLTFSIEKITGGNAVRNPRNDTGESEEPGRHNRSGRFGANGEFPRNRSTGKMAWTPFYPQPAAN